MCKFCNGIEEKVFGKGSYCETVTVSMSGDYLDVEIEGSMDNYDSREPTFASCSFRISYCPFCGKKFEEE
jgi:hypothetical protein